MLVSDAVAFGRDQLIVTERDNGQGATAPWKKAFVVDVPDHARCLLKREIVDLHRHQRTSTGISLRGARPGDFGLGNPFKFPYSTVEVRPAALGQRADVRQRRTNFGSTGRNAKPSPDFTATSSSFRVPGIKVVPSA